MLQPDSNFPVSPATLRELIRNVEPSAVLVEPRILRRVIRMDHRLSDLGGRIPSRRSYVVQRDRLLAFADYHELELASTTELPDVVILLAKVGERGPDEVASGEQTLRHYWRQLFRSRIQRQLEEHAAAHGDVAELAANRRAQIGETEFAEIRGVLQKDDLLFPHPSDWDVYVEFVATYLDLRYFAEGDLRWFFPAIRRWDTIHTLVSADVDHAHLFALTRLPGAYAQEPPDAEPDMAVTAWPSDEGANDFSRWARWRSLADRARRAAAAGNDIKAAIFWMRLAAKSPPDRPDGPAEEIDQCLRRFAARLQHVFEGAVTAERWYDAVRPLLAPTARSKRYWSAEARLLYDLQKVCVENERGVFRVHLLDWIRSAVLRPARHPLPLLRQVLISKHLRSAARRLPATRISLAARKKLSELLATTVAIAEHRTRDEIRPRIVEVLDQVGLTPRNVPESVSQGHVAEELLDRIVEKGAINLGNLRDAISRNDLKLPDLESRDLLRGDPLLRADRRLGEVLEGIYRPGAIYLRWAQRLSSVVFGTEWGRFATRYLLLPYGGAYLAVEGVRHLVALVTGESEMVGPDGVTIPVADHGHATPFAWPATAILGTWVLLLMHWPAFRAWSIGLIRLCGRACRVLFVDLPALLMQSAWMRRILQSPIYEVARSYFLQPAIATALLIFLFRLLRRPLSAHGQFELFLALMVLMNSPVGRLAVEWFSDVVRKTWNELRFRVFAAIFQWIMDAFHRLMGALEQLVYTVDEWLRFRAGDNRQVEVIKVLASTCWFFISYIIVFVFTLLVEPQVNPIKHFPVVTVSHKLILPAGPTFVDNLTPYLGKARATTLVWSTIWLIPGVFGFLVWELKENWRLYASNRPRQLIPVAIGHHGETMARLLRPGIHSGTLPKSFALVRRSLRKAQATGRHTRARQQQEAVARTEEAVMRFVERDFVTLLEKGGVPRTPTTHLTSVHAATNRIDVLLGDGEPTGYRLRLSWREVDGKLTGSVEGDRDSVLLTEDQRQRLGWALAGLFQRTGVDAVEGSPPIPVDPPFTWSQWVARWPARSPIGIDATPPDS